MYWTLSLIILNIQELRQSTYIFVLLLQKINLQTISNQGMHFEYDGSSKFMVRSMTHEISSRLKYMFIF